MKQILKVISVKAVKITDDLSCNMVELTCLPYEHVKIKKPKFMDMVGGDLDSLMSSVQGMQVFETKIYMPLNVWLSDFKNELFSNIEVDVSINRFASEIAKEKI